MYIFLSNWFFYELFVKEQEYKTFLFWQNEHEINLQAALVRLVYSHLINER